MKKIFKKYRKPQITNSKLEKVNFYTIGCARSCGCPPLYEQVFCQRDELCGGSTPWLVGCRLR